MLKLTTKIKIAYSCGQFGWSIVNGLITTYLLFYYVPTQETGIRSYLPNYLFFGFISILTCIFIVDRIVGSLVDPWIASRSDRSQSKYGRRISYMGKSALPLSLFATLIFVNPIQGESWLNAVFLFATLLLFYFFFGMYVTPYNALYTEITKNEKDRIDLATMTSITWFVGYIITGLAPNIWLYIEQNFQIEKYHAFQITMLLFSIIACVLLLIPVLSIKEAAYSEYQPVQADESFWESLRIAFKNRYFRMYIIADLMFWIALYFFQMTILQYVVVLLKLPESYLILFTGVLGIASFLFYIPVNMIAKKIGKKKVLLFGYIIFAFAYGLTAFLGFYPTSALIQGLIVVGIASVPIAIFGILPNVVIADIVEADTYKTGAHRGGIYFGARTFVMKFANVVSLGILSIVLLLKENGSNEKALRFTTIVALVFVCIGFLILKLGYDEIKMKRFLNTHRDHLND